MSHPSADPTLAAATDAVTVQGRPALGDRVPAERLHDPDRILDLFLGWVADAGFELYPAQEEAILEVMAGRHVVLNTPTGSGKSMVALAVHFKALCEGKRAFYTSPIKALASEKFFDLCDLLGAARVGMQTGDAAINPDAAIVCATAEVLMNRALRQGPELGADYVVMDEFHYYGDPDRGVAWQVPLLTLPYTRFLLMSATLGNVAPITERLTARTGVDTSLVYSVDRPVPLDYEYRETPLHETVEALLDEGRAPIYVVNFTQRECAELAQALTSARITTREERERVREAIGEFRFDTPYGKDIRRFLGFGVGIHHAGLLPKYRLLVEQLAQQGLLKVICGTDTLGVGVNIPIRTVLFTKLSKYDGEKVTLLRVRDFQQISGRAGRKGFDEKGSVVCQAPDHVIEAKRAEEKGKKKGKKRPPPGFVGWTEETFQRLIHSPPEMLESQFRITHGMLVQLLQRDADVDDPSRANFASLRELLALSHESDVRKRQILSEVAVLVRSLHRAGVIEMQRDTDTAYWWIVVSPDLQWDFSLFQTLALYLVEALEVLDPTAEDYALDVLTLTEAILEDPRVVLYRQVDKAKGDLIAELKAAGMPYEERMERLDRVRHPMPNLELVERTFDAFREIHPWVRDADLHPKSIGREMFEGYFAFHEYVRHYGLQRSEGVLLRYLSQLYKTLDQTVPERTKTEAVYDVLGYFRTMLEHVDKSLIEEWESLLHPELQLEREEAREEARRELRAYELFHDPKAFAARVRAELHQLVRALAEEDFEDAVPSIRPEPEGPSEPWDAERLAAATAELVMENGPLVFDHHARMADKTTITATGPRTWDVTQTLVSRDGPTLWALHGRIDLRDPAALEGPLLRLDRIGP